MNISRKLFIGFALVSSLAIVVGAIGIFGMHKLREAGLSLYEKQVIGLERLEKASAAFKDTRLSCNQVVINSFYDDLKGAIDAKERFYKGQEEFIYWMGEFYKVAATEELVKFHDRILSLFLNEYLPKAEKVIEISIKDIPDHSNKLRVRVMLASIVSTADQIERLVNGILNLEEALAKQTNSDNAQTTKLFIQLQSVLLSISVIIAIIVTIYITGSITRPISEAADVLQKIAKGDFDAKFTGNYSGEFAVIKNSINATAIDLKSYLEGKLCAERSVHEAELAQGRAEAAKEAILSSINYASKIQNNLLPNKAVFKEAFSDYSVIWKPKDIVGGDIYWLKNFDEGSILCVADCTGHGTPGALLTMLVVSALESSANKDNYKDTAEVIWQLEQRLIHILNVNSPGQGKTVSKISNFKDGCDLAVLFIAKDGTVSISAGNMPVFICDGESVRKIKGQKLYIGEGRLKSKEDVQVITIPANPANKFYVASDGLYDQIGGESYLPFGYRPFKQILLENHNENQSVITGKILEAFESYRGDNLRRDDVELISFKP